MTGSIARKLSLGMVAVVAALAACGGDDTGDGGSAAGGGGGDGAALEAYPESAAGESAGGSQSGLALAGSAVPSVSDSVIKTAHLDVEVDRGRLDEAIRSAETIAAQYGGFVYSTSVQDDEAKRGSVVIRVPSEDFENALGDVKNEGALKSQRVTGKDVSEEFIDLEARIRNLEAQEAVVLSLMDRATTISQTIRIQNQLSGLQLEIERFKGRLRFREERIA